VSSYLSEDFGLDELNKENEVLPYEHYNQCVELRELLKKNKIKHYKKVPTI
jgi:hypothetical protein